MTVNEANVFFKAYLELITGRVAVKAPYKGPQKHDPYITYKVFKMNGYAYDIETRTCTGVEPDINMHSGMRNLTRVEYEIESLGGDYMGVLRRLESSFRSTIFLDKLTAVEFGGFGLSDVTETIDTSAPLINSVFEDRAQMSVSFYIALSEDFDIDHYNHTDITIVEEDKEYSKTITIPEQE